MVSWLSCAYLGETNLFRLYSTSTNYPKKPYHNSEKHYYKLSLPTPKARSLFEPSCASA